MNFYSDDPLSVVQAREMVSFFAPPGPASMASLSLGGLAFVTFTPQDLRAFTGGEGMKRNEAWINRNNKIYAGEGWIVTQSPFGSPGAAMLLEELIAFGVKRAVFIGYCGSLQKGIDVGDVVVPTDTVREEGTSHHYLRSGEKSLPDHDLQRRLSEWMEGIPVRVHTGKIWTTDAPYRETFKKVDHYRNGRDPGRGNGDVCRICRRKGQAYFRRRDAAGVGCLEREILGHRISFSGPESDERPGGSHLLAHVQEMIP